MVFDVGVYVVPAALTVPVCVPFNEAGVPPPATVRVPSIEIAVCATKFFVAVKEVGIVHFTLAVPLGSTVSGAVTVTLMPVAAKKPPVQS
ncbi:hypothetical protein AB0I81_55100 [Nonomuraea sp. NPDC050404]|uniref:hypothetical protein n=1 Tax=Nonomuraea sp. NPDC050404 TaxID=3155783 RepID=UPI0033DF47FA